MMRNLNYVLDEYAKQGILDGNAVERICAAAQRDANCGKTVTKSFRVEVQFTEYDENGVHQAFNATDLQDAVDSYGLSNLVISVEDVSK